MRRYIRNEELTSALSQLVEYRNPEMIDVYRQIIAYRLGCKTNACAKVARILACPQKSVLALFNAILLLILLIACLLTTTPFVTEETSLLLALSLILLSIGEGYRFFRLYTLMHAHREYLLVDELFARKILVIRNVRPRHSFNTAK